MTGHERRKRWGREKRLPTRREPEVGDRGHRPWIPVRVFRVRRRHALSASATFRGAKTRAACKPSSRSRRTYANAISFQTPGGSGLPAPPSQNFAMRFCSGVSVSWSLISSSASLRNAGEPKRGEQQAGTRLATSTPRSSTCLRAAPQRRSRREDATRPAAGNVSGPASIGVVLAGNVITRAAIARPNSALRRRHSARSCRRSLQRVSVAGGAAKLLRRVFGRPYTRTLGGCTRDRRSLGGILRGPLRPYRSCQYAADTAASYIATLTRAYAPEAWGDRSLPLRDERELQFGPNRARRISQPAPQRDRDVVRRWRSSAEGGAGTAMLAAPATPT